MRTGLRRNFAALVLLALAAAPAALTGQGAPDSLIRTRVDAFFAALASGSPEAFEAMAREHGTPALMSRRTPAERAELLKRLRDDFGTMTLGAVRVNDEQVVLQVAGATGITGRFTLTLAPDAAFRIEGFGVDVQAGGGRDAAAPLEPPPPVSPELSDEALTGALDAYLTTLSNADRFSGVVLIARGGRTAFARAYGLADREMSIPNTTDTRYNVGSINKSFTQVAIAQLMAQGRLKPTDTVGALLPDHPNSDARPATVQQLLEHRGGIADFFGPGYAAVDKATLRSNSDYYALVASQPLTFAPGTSRRYCNGCYIVLGEIITRVTGQPYEAYISSHVFAPAGMKRTAFLGPEPRTPDVARGYTRRGAGGDSQLRPNTSSVGARGSAAGGAYATAADLLAYVGALRAHTLLAAEDARRFLGPQGDGSIAVAGGAPGINALVHARGDAVVVVLANADPPTAERLGEALAARLVR